ncbi:glycoside hydrolase family 3 protein [Atractiella rhizophila]|nr:glycoside hydrolase family 3 protein [Atractiella rhizophila]
MKTLFALAPLLSPVLASQADYELLANVYKRADIDLTGPGWNDYEAPLSTGGIAWAEGSSRAKKVVSQMTLDEKLMIVTGVDGRCVGVVPNITRLGIPALCLEDGPLGVRPVKGVTQFPSGVTIAATWDKELMYERGKAIGQEFFDLGVNMMLGPVAGGPMGRSPRGGRNWEGFFSDGYATGVATYESTLGMRASSVMTVAKHYIGNEQETLRNPAREGGGPFGFTGPIVQNAVTIDDKTMHELYLWPFAEAVRAGNEYVMCSYQRRGVMSDWGAVHGTFDYFIGGTDLQMPGSGFGGVLGADWASGLSAAVKNGTIPETRLNDAVVRVLTPWYANQADKQVPSVPFNAGIGTDFPVSYRNVQKPSSVQLTKKVGEDSITLLKNNGALPLNAPQQIAIVGEDAGPNIEGPQSCGDGGSCPVGINTGTQTIGGGSAYVYPKNLITPLQAIQSRAAQDGSLVQFTLNSSALDSFATVASTADVCIVFESSYATEGEDRLALNLDSPNATEAILSTAALCNNTVVVLHIPGPVIVEEWVDHPNVTAVLVAHYPGEQAGNSLVSVLYGDVSPSGRLPYTIGKSEDDYPPDTIYNTTDPNPETTFSEGVNIDYKWFDSHNITPRYEFGFGLSYAKFEYSSISLSKSYKADTFAVQKTAEPFAEYNGKNSLYDVVATVTAKVKNVGGVKSSEVAQLYVQFPESEGEPPRSLRGFDKLKDIAPGSTSTATFDLRRKDLSVWDTVQQKWKVPSGSLTIYVGSSSRNLPLHVQAAF